MQRFFDRIGSFMAALVTLAVCGGPVWFTVQSVRAEIAPIWAYGFAGALGLVGLILAFAFFRKGLKGVAPTRMRQR